mgnify:CR=1 FL=1
MRRITFEIPCFQLPRSYQMNDRVKGKAVINFVIAICCASCPLMSIFITIVINIYGALGWRIKSK